MVGDQPWVTLWESLSCLCRSLWPCLLLHRSFSPGHLSASPAQTCVQVWQPGRQPGAPWGWLLQAHTWDSAPAQQPPSRDISLQAASAFACAQEAFVHPLCMSIQPEELVPCSQPPHQQTGAAVCAHASPSCDWEGLEIITGIIWAALTCTWRHTGGEASTNALGNALCSHCPAKSE